MRHLLPAYHSRGCLSEYGLNHELEDQIQKNRVRPCGRTLPSQFTIRFVDNNRELYIANRSLRIALLVKLAIKATDNSDMYNRAFPTGGNFLFFVVCMMSLLCLPSDRWPSSLFPQAGLLRDLRRKYAEKRSPRSVASFLLPRTVWLRQRITAMSIALCFARMRTRRKLSLVKLPKIRP